MNTLLLKTGLRQQAIFIPETVVQENSTQLSPTTGLLVANLAKLGFGVTEDLLHALNHTTPAYQATILETFREVMGVNKNWTPLIKNWEVPTHESLTDHLITWFTNIFKGAGTTLQCGHIIPANTFPLERYNGCPFCGTPFETGEIEHYGQGSKLRILKRWNTQLAADYLKDLLSSKTALDATQVESMKTLLSLFPLPAVKIGMKETLVAAVDVLIEKDQAEEAGKLFTTPTDILRYLWYKQTGFLQLIKPGTIVKRNKKNQRQLRPDIYPAVQRPAAAATLKLKYNRRQGLMVACWLNHLHLEAGAMCEIMHPQRGMWVRFIRALRLAEFSQRPGLEKLREMMDRFYRQDYTVWQGHVNKFRLRYDEANTMQLLKQRPGLFARSLFANMLWFSPDGVTAAFAEITDKVPMRLLLTLQMYSLYYFDKNTTRSVKPLGGVNKSIPANQQLRIYEDEQLQEMQQAVTNLCIGAIKQRFAKVVTNAGSIFIAPELYRIPLAIGDRSEQVQDLPGALMGTRFKVESDKIILFMQWGKGMPAQHLDMDLSCRIAYDHHVDTCSFAYLKTTGCTHSGDIRSIPDQVGTAEYIAIDIPELEKAGARYVTFTCNAYCKGALSLNMVLGWMNSQHPMKISEKKGVAYDPSCVEHMVRITGGLTKGLVFGVLDVAAREIIWLEMAFDGQVAQDLSFATVQAILKKLDSKLSIGQFLEAKAAAQQLVHTDADKADEVYTLQWATNTAAVTQLFID
ncbi:hypothetical protein [Chitinophaga arvensicola]|uniref:Uncharacterized protein n=1 Tax=Chitinophaga arvensicola TaxID=29529 RepID=A0A1I0S8X0_9BACT|nr:hypothetical protein [Chitinophaga arvensicola]SEW52580.1 hypothetical protein SAMN04488122_4949 [Chitinophaga arvensicola]